MPPSLTLLFSKQEQNLWCQVTEICQMLLMVFVAHGQGRIQGAKMRCTQYASSHQSVSKMFLMYIIVKQGKADLFFGKFDFTVARQQIHFSFFCKKGVMT